MVVLVGAERFAFPASHVDEAMDAPALQWVPVAPAGMVGQLRYRDRMVPAWDAGWAFGVVRGAGAGAAIVLRDGVRRFALMVDDVVDMWELELGRVRGVPAGADASGVLSGVALSGEGAASLVNVVRVESLVNAIGAAAAAPAGGAAR
jgi:chemotaxis signal transduction protein